MDQPRVRHSALRIRGACHPTHFMVYHVPTMKTSRAKSAANPLRQYSSLVLDGPERAPSRAMLYAVGFKPEDFKKPIVGIASTWSMVTPCNMHIDQARARSRGGRQSTPAARPSFSTPSPSPTASPWAPRA